MIPRDSKGKDTRLVLEIRSPNSESRRFARGSLPRAVQGAIPAPREDTPLSFLPPGSRNPVPPRPPPAPTPRLPTAEVVAKATTGLLGPRLPAIDPLDLQEAVTSKHPGSGEVRDGGLGVKSELTQRNPKGNTVSSLCLRHLGKTSRRCAPPLISSSMAASRPAAAREALGRWKSHGARLVHRPPRRQQRASYNRELAPMSQHPTRVPPSEHSGEATVHTSRSPGLPGRGRGSAAPWAGRYTACRDL